MESYAAFDLAGYLVAGTNGEANVLDADEKVELVRAAKRRAAGKRVLAGTGVESTRATIALTRRCADAGADGVLVLTPHYFKTQMTPDALRRHYEAVADASPVPVYLYSMTACTGIVFPPVVAQQMAAHPNVAGMKESSTDLGLFGRILSVVPDSFTMACGSAPVVYPALCMGARAAILAVACCAPGPVVALYQAFTAGDHDRARRLQEAITPLATAVTVTYGIAGLKRAVDLAGMRGGHARAPLLPPPPEAAGQIRALLQAAESAAPAG